jgi:Uma2 family endonuclease
LIEVADTTSNYDTGEKAVMYAQFGIGEYWVVLINRRELVAFRHPLNGEYTSTVRLTGDDLVTPVFAPDIAIPVSDLLPRVSPNPLVQEG